MKIEINVIDAKSEFDDLTREVREWNEKTFPEATREGQFAKLEEEMAEFKEAAMRADDEKMSKEFADILIVLMGLTRWKSLVADYLLKRFTDCSDEEVERLIKNVRAKMKINRERSKKGLWKKTEVGSYHH